MAEENIAVIAYGIGGDLGDFEVFANSLKNELSAKYKTVQKSHVTRDTELFELLINVPPDQKIAELHIFSHAIGAGLFIGYHDPEIQKKRLALLSVYGATSGSHIEVKYKSKWTSTQTYKDQVHHWPSPSLPHRLAPDKGNYREYKP